MSNPSVFKKIKRDNLVMHFVGGIALIVIAIILAFVLIPKTTKYLLAQKNVFAVPSNNYKIDQFYRGKTYCLYDWFAENDEGRFYIAPVENKDGDENYLIVFIPKTYANKADRIIEQTYDYIDSGDESDLKESINCRGYMSEISTKTNQYLEEYFDMVGAPGATKLLVCKYMFVMVPMQKVLLSESLLYIILSVALIVGGIALFLTGFTKGYLKKLKEKLARENMTVEDLEKEFSPALHQFKQVYVSNKHAISAVASPVLLTIEDVVWIYPSKTNQVNSAPIYRSVFFTRYHECIQYQFKDEATSEALCRAVHELHPKALYGYVIENTTMYYNNFQGLVDQIYNGSEDAVAESNTPAPAVPEVSQIPEAPQATEAPISSDESVMPPEPVYPEAPAFPEEPSFPEANTPSGFPELPESQVPPVFPENKDDSL